MRSSFGQYSITDINQGKERLMEAVDVCLPTFDRLSEELGVNMIDVEDIEAFFQPGIVR